MTATTNLAHQRSNGVAIELVPTAAIAPPTWDEIWDLSRIFYDTERGWVEGNLKGHQRIILFRSRSEGELIGMASVDINPATFRGQRLVSLFTSHVLIREQYRGHNLIQRIGFQIFLATRFRYPLHRIYWFFDTFSYKSYLLLSRNFREYWPRFDRPTPEWEQALMNQLAEQAYGPAWRSAQGIAARSGHTRLRPETAPLEETLARDPDIAFYVRANPGHAEGDMLVCLCPMTAANWFNAAVRALKRTALRAKR
jgi:hypothetical protein